MTSEEARALFGSLLHRVAPEVDLDTVDLDAPLQEAMDLDSMDFLNLVTALHEQTGIDIPEQDYRSVSTVGGFIAYIVAATGTCAGPNLPKGPTGDARSAGW